VIVINNLLKKFNLVVAVDINHLQITNGEIFGLVGNNGAGKTSLFRLMLDLLEPDNGSVLSKGENVYKSDHWKRYTGSFIDNNFLIEFLKPEEYFEFIGFLYGLSASELKLRLDEFGAFMNGEVLGKNKYIRSLSSGNKQKVGIVGAMISLPEILILDEPFNFLDPSSQDRLKKLLRKYYGNNSKSLVISSHNLNHISDLCSRVALMEKGEIIKDCLNNFENMKVIRSYFDTQVKII
jgi:ABC-2 type transport system ATP-binding protein